MLRFLLFVSAITMMGAAPARAAMEDYPSVKLQGLDKSTARTTTFEAKVGSTITYGPLFIRVQSCRKAPPIEKPESAAFVQIWEVPPETGKSEWVFSGWMFASSPALSAMDHPVYDIWVLDCSGREEPNEEAAASETDATATQEDLAAPTPEGQAPVTDSEAAPIVDSEAAPVDSEAPPATDTQTQSAGEEVPLDSEAAGTPEPESTMPSTPAPGPAFDPSMNPDAPYYPAAPAPQGQGALPVDPDAPYVPAPPPGQQDGRRSPAVDYDAPYSPPSIQRP